LTKHALTLTTLELQIDSEWHPRARDLPPSTSPEASAYFLNTIMNQFKKLEHLQFNGPLASSAVFGSMPSTLEVLHWGLCPAIEPMRESD